MAAAGTLLLKKGSMVSASFGRLCRSGDPDIRIEQLITNQGTPSVLPHTAVISLSKIAEQWRREDRTCGTSEQLPLHAPYRHPSCRMLVPLAGVQKQNCAC